jgi:hypothetical protein
MNEAEILAIVIGGIAILVAIIIGGIQIYQGNIQISLSRNHKSFPIQINIKSRNASNIAKVSSEITESIPLEINIIPEINEKDQIYRKDITPDDIYIELNKFSPFQRMNAFSNFTDLKVEWDLFFEHIFPFNNKFCALFVTKARMNTVSYILDIKDYPELKIAPRGTIINVRGTISGMREGEIELKNVSLIIPNLLKK